MGIIMVGKDVGVINKTISQLDRISKSIGSIGEEFDYTDVAIEALEKQIPKKPNNIKIIKDFYEKPYTKRGNCPVCGRERMYAYELFCCNCGQALDWWED